MVVWEKEHERVLKTRFIRSLLIAVGLIGLLTACYPESLLPPETFPAPATIPRAVTTPPEEPTAVASPLPAPLMTPQDTRTGVDAVTRALEASNSRTLSNLLLDPVWLAQGPNGDQGQSLSRGEVAKWLDARWGQKRAVVSTDYVQHVVLLEVKTSGWIPLAPLQSGVIAFNLHRYNPQGQTDPLQGAWRIDTILYY